MVNSLKNLRLDLELNKLNIGIVDYGIGNLTSLFNFFKKIDAKPIISKNPDILNEADLLVLPGVGTFEVAMRNMVNNGLDNYIKSIKNKKIIGICLGAQILFESSLEGGDFEGLGLIPGCVVPIATGTNTGWDQVYGTYFEQVFKGEKPHFYFNHSLKIECDDKYVLGYSSSSIEKIPSMILSGNLFGFQFHPEKSQLDGEVLIRNIIQYNG